MFKCYLEVYLKDGTVVLQNLLLHLHQLRHHLMEGEELWGHFLFLCRVRMRSTHHQVFIPTQTSWGEAFLRFVHRAAWDRLSEESCPLPTAPPTRPAGSPSVRRTVPPSPHWGRCSAPSPYGHRQRLNSRQSAYHHCRAETSSLFNFLISTGQPLHPSVSLANI